MPARSMRSMQPGSTARARVVRSAPGPVYELPGRLVFGGGFTVVWDGVDDQFDFRHVPRMGRPSVRA